MIDMHEIYTFWSAIGTSIVGGVYWAYGKYKDLTTALQNRPTKEEIQAMLDHENDKLDPRLESIEKSVQDLHDDVKLLMSYLLNASRTPTENSGKPTNPTSLH